MELVSANTKEFMYMTMSQYNDLEKSVPARVQIRRDQPFWSGGNSYLACEAFRITCSPSRDGLYYKRIPHEWFIRAGRRQQLGDHNQAYAAPATGRVSVIDAIPIHSLQDFTVRTSLQIQNGAANAAPPTKDPELLQEELCALQRVLQCGQEVRVAYQTPAAAGGQTYGTIVSDFMGSLRSRGFGPKGMYFPKATAATSDEAALLALRQQQVTFTIPCASNSMEEVSRIVSMFGGPLYYQNVENEAHQFNAGSNVSNDPLFEILGPEGIGVDGDFPAGRALYANVAGVAFGELQYKIFWDGPLEIGTRVFCEWRGIGVHPGVAGVVSRLPRWLSLNNQTVQVVLRTKSTAQIVAAIQARIQAMGGAPPRTPLQQWVRTLALRGVFHRSSSDWTGHIYSRDMEIQLPALPAAPNTIAQVTGFACPANMVNTWEQISERRGGEKLADGTQSDVYTYTPNGFCNFFNTNLLERPREEQLPYNLQCDVNGGFAIQWHRNSSNTAQAWTSFSISRALHLALGLNDYFEWNESGGGEPVDRTEPTFTCIRQTDERDLFDRNCDSIHALFRQNDLYQMAGQELVPLPTIAVGDIVYTADAAGWKVIATSTVEVDKRQSVKRRAFPAVRLLPDGTEYLEWSSLPMICMMRNNQKVSVESFQTFNVINLVIPNLPFQPMIGTDTDERILASLRIPFPYNTGNTISGAISNMSAPMMGDLLWNSDDSRSYLKITTDQELYDVDVEARLIRRDGSMEKLKLPFQGQFQVKLRFLEVQ